MMTPTPNGARPLRLVAATDFSPCSEYAVRYAAALVRTLGVHLEVVHALDPAAIEGGDTYGIAFLRSELEQTLMSCEEHAHRRLEGTAEELREAGVDVSTRVLRGAPASALVAHARHTGAQLIAVGTHGRSGIDRLVYGSTCEAVVRRSPLPVLSIRQPGPGIDFNPAARPRIARVVCALDGTAPSTRALPIASAFCHEFDARLILLEVVEPGDSNAVELESPQMDGARAWLEQVAVQVGTVPRDLVVAKGTPRSDTAQRINLCEPDLVVMATYGRRGLTHALFGSVTGRVLRAAKCPVLTVPVRTAAHRAPGAAGPAAAPPT